MEHFTGSFVCPNCGKDAVKPALIEYDAKVNHDGRLHQLHIEGLKVNRCSACGEIFFDATTDAQISQRLREHLRLLSPSEIRQGIEALGLTQSEFAEETGIAPETISRWLSGAYIQSRAMNTLMRLFFDRGRPAHVTITPDTATVPADAHSR